MTLFSSLRRLRTHGNRLVSARKALKPLARPEADARNGRERRRAHPKRAGTRADVRDALPAVRAAVLDAPLEALLPSEQLAGPASLFSVAAELVRAQLLGPTAERIDADADPFLPPHLHDVLSGAYSCASCSRFVLPSSLSHIPPFTERAHHLDPGISLPSRLVPPPVPVPALFSPPTTPPLQREQHPPRFLSAAERPATLEQRLLLALLARLDAPPPPPPAPPRSSRRRGSEASLSSLGSSSRPGPGAARAPPPLAPPPRRRDREGSRRQDRVPALPTLVLGAPAWRFCALCAAAHLGMDDVLARRADQELDDAEAAELGSARAEALRWAATVRSWQCGCLVCHEERRVRGLEDVDEAAATAAGEREGQKEGEGDRGKEGGGRTRVLRWFRRKEQPREDIAAAGGGYGRVD